jgi:exosortase H (IPTLxxWG-CTERM-specific)
MVRFLVLFIVLGSVIFGLQLTPVGQEYFVIPWTNGLAHFCAQLVAMFDDSAVAMGKVLKSSKNNFAVSIEAGCNGIEATIILLAAVLAFPSTIKQKLWGLAIGFVAIQALNVVRIISLFYIGQWNMTVFEWAHLHIWPALIILDALIFFMIWLRFVTKQKAKDELPPPTASGGGGTPASVQPA